MGRKVKIAPAMSLRDWHHRNPVKRKRKLDAYPPEWPATAIRIKAKAGWRCERCKHPNDQPSGHVLTVHHLDGNKHNLAEWNLAALCQRCHLKIQGRVKMDQMFFAEILDVSEWFRPHLVGFLASRNLPETAGECRTAAPPPATSPQANSGDRLTQTPPAAAGNPTGADTSAPVTRAEEISDPAGVASATTSDLRPE